MAKVRRFFKKGRKRKNSSKIVIIISVMVVLVIAAVLAFKFDLVKITKEDRKITGEAVKGDFAAKVNDEVIDYPTLDKQYSLFFTLTDYPEEYKEVITKEKYLGQLVVESLLLQEAEKEGITTEDIGKEEVKELVNNYIKQQQDSEGEFVKKLVDNKLTIDDVTEYFKRQAVMMELLNSTVLRNVKVSDKVVEEYYENNKEDFIAGKGQIRVRHILVETEEEAEEIIDLLEDGSSFSELASERSQDPGSAVRGGDLGFFTKEQMIEEFSDAAFALEDVGDIGEPVKTVYGYHIIQKESDEVSLEEAEDGIRMVLLADKQREVLQYYLEELKSESEIILNEVE